MIILSYIGFLLVKYHFFQNDYQNIKKDAVPSSFYKKKDTTSFFILQYKYFYCVVHQGCRTLYFQRKIPNWHFYPNFSGLKFTKTLDQHIILKTLLLIPYIFPIGKLPIDYDLLLCVVRPEAA